MSVYILIHLSLAEVGGGTSVWTVSQGVDDKEKALGEDGEDLSDNEDADDSTKERSLILIMVLYSLILFHCSADPVGEGV